MVLSRPQRQQTYWLLALHIHLATRFSDNETWPACLERKLGRGVDNGGVMGYGAAQALRRASLKLTEKNYSALVLSVTVGSYDSDFERDRLNYRAGFPKPAVIHTKDGIAWSAVPDPNVPGTKYNQLPNTVLSLAYERSEMLAAMVHHLFPQYNFAGDWLTTVHPNAADENEIVDWTLRKLSNLKIKNKMLLLLYSSPDTNATDVAEQRRLILRIANQLSLKVVDTSNVLRNTLRNTKESELWNMDRHYTPLGNEIICSYLFEHGF
jgi:hypothetical protein